MDNGKGFKKSKGTEGGEVEDPLKTEPKKANAVTNLQVLDIIEAMEAFLERKRPPEHIRPKLDIGYRIDGQSVIIHTIRPFWNDASKIQHSEVAKTTFVKTKNYWKVFWLRSDLKWYAYDPKPTVKTLKDFLRLVEEDKHACFWG